jgi:MFS family permease
MNTENNVAVKPSAEMLITLALSCVSFLITLDMMSINLIMPTIAAEFNADIYTLGYVITGFTLASLIFTIPFGKLGDTVGTRRVYLLGIGVFAVASFLITLSTSSVQITVWRVAQGLGYALITAMSNVMVHHYISSANTGKILGIVNSISALAAVLGPIVVGVILHYLDWTWIFLLNIPFSIVAIVIIRRYCDSTAIKPVVNFDYLGFLSWIVLALVLYYFINTMHQFDRWSLAAVFASILLFFAFKQVEKRAVSPIIDFSIFSDSVFTVMNFCRLIVSFVSYTLLFLVVLYLQNVEGYSPIGTSVIFMDVSIAMVVAAVLSGVLIDKYGPYDFMIGISITLALCFLYCAFPHARITASDLVVFFVMGLAFGAVRPCISYIVIKRISKEKEGISNAVSVTMLPLGGLLGVTISSNILEKFSVSHLNTQLHALGIQLDAGMLTTLRELATGTKPITAAVLATDKAEQLIQIARDSFKLGYRYCMLVSAMLFALMLLLSIYSKCAGNAQKKLAFE